jgi:GTP-binding protein
MLPVIALVGRPNVGKSTLFNRLTRTRDALVADFPGLTRDRKYGQANYDGYEFIVVDTGGIDGSEEGIETEMAEQSLLAIEEADIVLFLVDARAGMNAADQAIAQHLRKQEKKCFVVANKTDGIDADSHCAEFYQLSLGDVHQIAAAHGRGVTQLLDLTLQPVIAELASEEEELEQDDESLAELYLEGEDGEKLEEGKTGFEDKPVKLAIIGRPNVGKSTLTNRILGEERVIVYDMPGTTRDSIYIPMTRNDKEYVLIDTAGVRKRKKVSDVVEKFSVIKTLQAIEDANVVLLVIDAREGISDQDLSLLGFALNSGRSLVIAINKWDGLDEYVKERIKTELDRRLGFIDFARLHFISALHGTGVGHLFESVDEAYESVTKRISTAMLRRIMDMAQADHQPPLVRGRRVKLKYAHAGGYNPPRIVIHGNQVHDLPDSYKRYLMNYYRKALGIMGTPIKIEFKEGDNPYAGRSNKMTLSQKRKLRAFSKESRNKDS